MIHGTWGLQSRGQSPVIVLRLRTYEHELPRLTEKDLNNGRLMSTNTMCNNLTRDMHKEAHFVFACSKLRPAMLSIQPSPARKHTGSTDCRAGMQGMQSSFPPLLFTAFPVPKSTHFSTRYTPKHIYVCKTTIDNFNKTSQIQCNEVRGKLAIFKVYCPSTKFGFKVPLFPEA